MPRFTRAAGYTLPAPDESVLYARFSDVLRQALLERAHVFLRKTA
jgi:hypothetical protein